jgi:ATP-dependent Lhr-like helicase
VASWFTDRLGEPTDAQRMAWPRIAAGEHVLVTAPTGSGKTLAAFLWGLDRLLSGAWSGGGVRLLYVSPLRALGNDIRRNLLVPLAELRGRFTADGEAAPDVRVVTRTGDTSPHERRQMAKSPPEVLITTPESLNILLTSAGGRRLLDGIQTVILDEIHAVVDSKRGVHLLTAIERLTALSGEFQRIALSATVRPIERIARWVAGHRLTYRDGEPSFQPRSVAMVQSQAAKEYQLEVALPVTDPEASRDPDTLWVELTAVLKRTVRSNRSTLIFGNSKRTVEKVARFLNENEPVQLAYSHHGALSRELRAVVEERLKAGSLRAIVATSSLELGIDIGAIDEVALVQPPPTVASTVQRLGRAGHGVGQVSRGRLYPLHPLGLLEAAVLTRAVLAGDIEAAKPVTNALDVLAQVIVSMVVGRRWRIDELYDAIRTADAYRHLPRRSFDLVLDMLTGRFASTRIRSLRPLVSLDRIDGTVTARPGSERLLYLSGGTIPDRGYFHLRVDGSGAPLGQLDEEFVWERSVGDTFTLGVQTWRIQKITHNDVFVAPADARSAMAPFWRAEERDRSWFLSEKIGLFLEQLESSLDDEHLAHELECEYRLQPTAAAELVKLLREQRASCGTLPHRHRVVIEHTVPRSGRQSQQQLVLHTMWGGSVNRPFGYALAAAWHERTGSRPEIVHGDDCIVVTSSSADAMDDPFTAVRGERLEALLRSTLEETGYFGGRFREAAGRALLLPRGGHRRRTPLWINRQRAKELLEAVSGEGDFPLVLEAWRTCLDDEFDLDALHDRLAEVSDGRIEVQHVRTDTPSPFTTQVLWRQTNQLMYEDDRPVAAARGTARADLIRELVFASHLRPRLPRHLADTLQSKLQRTAPGYAPRSASELLDWLKERLLVPIEEWQELVAACERDHGLNMAEVMSELADRAASVALDGGQPPFVVCAIEMIPQTAQALGTSVAELQICSLALDHSAPACAHAALEQLVARTGSTADLSLEQLLSQWLAFYAPVQPGWIADVLAVDPSEVRRVLDGLTEDQLVVVDQLLDDTEELQVCDRENLERLLRLNRSATQPTFASAAPELLPLFLAHHQGLGHSNATLEDLRRAIELLFGWPVQAEVLETEILPARLDPYLPSWLDTLMSETDLEWFGCGQRRIALCLAVDRGLLVEPRDSDLDGHDDPLDEVFPHPSGRFLLTDLLTQWRGESSALIELLWEHAWRGEVTTDSLAPIRQGLSTGFRAEPVPPSIPAARRRRPRFERWRSQIPLTGTWRRLMPVDPPEDMLDVDEDHRERARLLLDRYGVVFRELLDRELPALRWSEVFRALRLLDLSG